MPLVYELLLAFNILEHVLAFGDADVIWKHLRVVIVEFEDSWKSVLSLLIGIKALEVFREIVKDKVFFEDRNDVSLLIIHDICGYLRIIVFLRGEILGVQGSLSDPLPELVLMGFNKKGLCTHDGAKPIHATLR